MENNNNVLKTKKDKNNNHKSCLFEILLYNENEFKYECTNEFDELKNILDKEMVNFIIINDISDVTLINKLSSFFNIDQMIIEDAFSVSELPKAQESDEQLLFTLELMELTVGGGIIENHMGLILGNYYVLLFKEKETNIFDDIKKRIEKGNSKARQKKADYLFYLLSDAIVDSYYKIVDEIDDRIDKIEVILLEKPKANYITNLYRIKQPMIGMRGKLYSIREALLNIVQGDNSLIGDETIPFLHDVKDHINNIIHMFDSSRDTLSDLLEINNSNINNRLNSSMKILTIITTLFIPLTLISSIYGMNFKFMPELSWKLGYPFALGVMIITGGVMFYIMKKNKLF